MTVAPRSANCVAVARPIPRDAPVTTTTRSSGAMPPPPFSPHCPQWTDAGRREAHSTQDHGIVHCPANRRARSLPGEHGLGFAFEVDVGLAAHVNRDSLDHAAGEPVRRL